MSRRTLLLVALVACGSREPAPSRVPTPAVPDAGVGVLGPVTLDGGSFGSFLGGGGFDYGGLGSGDDPCFTDPTRCDDSPSPPDTPDEDYVLVGACSQTKGIDPAETREDFEGDSARRSVGGCYEDGGYVGQNIDVDVTITVTPDLSIPLEIEVAGEPADLAACVQRALADHFESWNIYARSWLRSDLANGKRLAHETCALHFATPP